jgi:hypothetical protein
MSRRAYVAGLSTPNPIYYFWGVTLLVSGHFRFRVGSVIRTSNVGSFRISGRVGLFGQSYLNINCDIQTFCLFLQKGGENFAQVFIHLVLQNNKKREIVTLNIFFDFIILQNIIEFYKFFFKI